MNTPEIVEAISLLVDLFDRFDIPYFIGGSVASSFHGKRRATQDVDIVAAIQRHHVQILVKLLANDYYIDGSMMRTAILNQTSFNVLHNDTGIKVDVFVLQATEFARHELGRAREEVIEPGTRLFYVASSEDVILAKLSWWKLGGKASTRQWNDIIEIVSRKGSTLDRVYLRQFASQLGVADVLAQVFIDAGYEL